MKHCEMKDLIGKKILEIVASENDVSIQTDGGLFNIYHSQDCCESVTIHSIGDIKSLVGKVVETATDDTVEAPPELPEDRYIDSETWTKQTINGVEILWHGQSNGYYSETPHCELDETIKTLDIDSDLESNTEIKPQIVSE